MLPPKGQIAWNTGGPSEAENSLWSSCGVNKIAEVNSSQVFPTRAELQDVLGGYSLKQNPWGRCLETLLMTDIIASSLFLKDTKVHCLTVSIGGGRRNWVCLKGP